jgi:hypothetical protein
VPPFSVYISEKITFLFGEHNEERLQEDKHFRSLLTGIFQKLLVMTTSRRLEVRL